MNGGIAIWPMQVSEQRLLRSCGVMSSYLLLAFTAKKSTFSTISIPWLLTYTKSWSSMTTGWFGVALWLRNPPIQTISSPGWWFQFLLPSTSFNLRAMGWWWWSQQQKLIFLTIEQGGVWGGGDDWSLENTVNSPMTSEWPLDLIEII